MHDVEVWVCVDADGSYDVGGTQEEAVTRYTESVGDLDQSSGYRLVKVMLSIPSPKPIEITAVVPQVEGAAVVSVG